MAILCLWSSNAAALSLGRIAVQSALGEPLRAEVEIPEISADEVASLKTSIALPDAFRAAGLEYNPAMASLQVTLQRRADGRAYLRISGDKAINDPFVDMILEARWASGRIVRDYTMLFDPPKIRQAPPGAPTPAQVTPPSPAARPPAPAVAASPARPTPTSSPTVPSRPAPAPAAERRENGAMTVAIQRGDTAGKIAVNTKPANVSLDQMLVAMLRANPNAFIGDNVNRIRAGAIINIPTEEQATATEAAEATRIIVAQSKDFNDFRRKLASSAPSAPVVPADRQVSGAVQAKVEEKKPAAATPDKLTLTKGAILGKAAEDQLAAERSAQEAASRAAEMKRNISELSQLSAASGATAPIAAASQAAVAPPLPQASETVASSPAMPVSTPTVASATAVAPKAVTSAPKPAPLAPPEPNMLDGLIEDPLVPAGAVGLIALLAGLGIYRVRQRSKTSKADSEFQESRLSPDSFFGASGGQSIDTNDNQATGSSMMYSPSQLDAADDVDPVAEADVYLAYGRDIQAEEILKDALLTNPDRLAIHHKLLEIYAKRRDTQAFESIARQAYQASNGDASEWARVCELGLSIDPDNALYQPSGEPGNTEGSPSSEADLDASNLPLQTMAVLATSELDTGEAVDLDLDFSIEDEPANGMKPEAIETLPEAEEIDLDFGLETQVFERPDDTLNEASSNALEFTLPDLDINEQSLDTEASKDQAATRAAVTEPSTLPTSEEAEQDNSPPDTGMLEFDLESLSLDLEDSGGTASVAEPEPEPEMPRDPLVTKLALAEEFRAIGDDDGARALIDEVIAEASGDLKIEAQRALSKL